VDAVDWVESIPFQETRQYVQKVLQNTHIYRSRLAPDTVRPMSADLKRGQPAEISVAATDSVAEPAADCSGFSIKALLNSCE
jgi:soluble lytic murein transglycosylase